MERREFLTALWAGLGASVVATQAQALTRLAPGPISASDSGLSPQIGVATPEDMENAKVEKTFGGGYWRHRRRRARRYGRRYYSR